MKLSRRLLTTFGFSALLGNAIAQTWTPTTGGTYSWDAEPSNWNAAFPNGSGASADISVDFTGAQTINLNQSITVGSLTIGDTGASGDSAVTIAANGGSLTFQVNSGNATLSNTSAATNVISANIAVNSDLTINHGTNASNDAHGFHLSGQLSGSGNITRTGTRGTVRLSGDNSAYTGDWTLSNGNSTGFTQIDSDLALGAAPGVARTNITVTSNSVLQFGAQFTLHANRNIAVTGGSIYLNTFSTSHTAGVAGEISGVGGVARSKAGTIVLSGANTYTGNTLVSRGTLRAGSISAFGNNSAVTMGTNADSILDLNGFNNSIGSLAGGAATGGNVTLGTATLTSGGNNTSTSYAGVISGTGNFIKVGTGTQTFTGIHTYTGATTVEAGTLALGVDGAIADSSALTIDAGAKFDVSAKSGYTLGAGGLTLGVGATSAGLFDAGAGELIFGDTLVLDFTSAVLEESYSLFVFGSQSGDFASITLTGSIVGTLLLTGTDTWTGNAGGYDFSFSEASGTLAVTAIPEPSSMALMVGGIALASSSLVRRRRSGL